MIGGNKSLMECKGRNIDTPGERGTELVDFFGRSEVSDDKKSCVPRS